MRDLRPIRTTTFVAALSSAVFGAWGCNSDVDAPTSVSSNTGTGGDASSGAGAQGGAGAEGGAGGSVSTCFSCDITEFCDGPDGSCPGQGTPGGHCVPRPQCSGAVSDPVCGCDGVPYADICGAHANGVDIGPEGSCTFPRAGFACRGFLCEAGADFCAYDGNGPTPCQPVPDRCLATPDCACIQATGFEGCGCEEDADGNVLIQCIDTT